MSSAKRILSLSARIALGLALIASAFMTGPARAVDATWIFNGDGNWTDDPLTHWSGGVDPNSNLFDVFINDGNSAVTVSLNVDRTIGDLTIDADDAMSVLNNQNFQIDGNLMNSGLLTVSAANNDTDIRVEGILTVTYGLQMQALLAHGVHPTRLITTSSADSILGFVESGLGYSLVPSLPALGIYCYQ
jgi:hypothetical protein